MENDEQNDKPKIILKGKPQIDTKKNTEKTPTLYISPDNLDMVMDALLVEKYRPLVLSRAGPQYQKQLQNIIELYDSGKLYDFKIALVRSNNVLSTNQEYILNMNVKPYSAGQHTLKFGEHTLDGLKTYFNKKNLEQRIYSDSHLIE